MTPGRVDGQVKLKLNAVYIFRNGADLNNHLKKLENESVFILRQAYRSIKNIAMLWSLGKDSNVMMWLAFKAFFGNIPFPVVHVDTKKKI